METPEIFAGGSTNVARRAVVIGNGSPGAENQCLGLVRALGLADHLTLYRVTRPRGGINEWLHFLPISMHKLIDQVLRQFFRNTRLAPVVQGEEAVPCPEWRIRWVIFCSGGRYQEDRGHRS